MKIDAGFQSDFVFKITKSWSVMVKYENMLEIYIFPFYVFVFYGRD